MAEVNSSGLPGVASPGQNTEPQNEIAVTWLDEVQPPREAVEREARRLATILGHDLRLTLEN